MSSKKTILIHTVETRDFHGEPMEVSYCATCLMAKFEGGSLLLIADNSVVPKSYVSTAYGPGFWEYYDRRWVDASLGVYRAEIIHVGRVCYLFEGE